MEYYKNNNKFIIMSLFIFSGLLTVQYTHADQNKKGSVFYRGLSDFRTGNYLEAIEKLEAATVGELGCQETILTKAVEDSLEAMTNLFNQSDDDCDLVNGENLWDAHFYLALSYLKVKKKSKALKEIEKAKSVNAEKRPDPDIFSLEIINLFDVTTANNLETTDESWGSELRRGVNEHKKGNYKKSIRTLHRVVEKISSKKNKNQSENVTEIAAVDPECAMQVLFGEKEAEDCEQNAHADELWNSHFYLAISYYVVGNKKLAMENFILARKADKNREPDSEMFSPKIIGLYRSEAKAEPLYVKEEKLPEPSFLPQTNDKSKANSTQKLVQSRGNNECVSLITNKGRIVLRLDRIKAPESVNNFIGYTNSRFYDGTIFHRVIPGFMIQGGGFNEVFEKKQVRIPILNEANNGLLNIRGSVAAARRADSHSATSQFFINTVDNSFLNYTGKTRRGWGYAVFGQVVTGMDVVDTISSVSTGSGGPFRSDLPKKNISIEKARVVSCSDVM